jgi:hypothetical protein
MELSTVLVFDGETFFRRVKVIIHMQESQDILKWLQFQNEGRIRWYLCLQLQWAFVECMLRYINHSVIKMRLNATPSCF